MSLLVKKHNIFSTKALLMLFFVFGLLFLTGCTKVARFKEPDIKDDFCGPVMPAKYCRCAFHSENCEQLGLRASTANAYVKNEFARWVDYLLEEFKSQCELEDGWYQDKGKCEKCELPLVRQGEECIDTEVQILKNKKDEEFKPDGPLDKDCLTTKDFDKKWKKYSDIDNRIDLNSRSWEAQGVVKTHEKILKLMVDNFELKRDMEIDRQIRLELKNYRNAIARNLKQNLIKSLIRMTYFTYTTIESGVSAGKSFTTFLTGDELLKRAGGLLSAIKGTVPKKSNIAIDTKTVSGKVLNAGVEVAYQAMESLGNPKDVATKFMTETKKAIAPGPELSDGEIEILRTQKDINESLDKTIRESYRINAQRRANIIENENRITDLQAEAVAWEAKEKKRVEGMLEESCLKQKKEYEKN